MPPVKSALKTGAELLSTTILRREEGGEGGRVISPRHENKNLEKEAFPPPPSLLIQRAIPFHGGDVS